LRNFLCELLKPVKFLFERFKYLRNFRKRISYAKFSKQKFYTKKQNKKFQTKKPYAQNNKKTKHLPSYYPGFVQSKNTQASTLVIHPPQTRTKLAKTGNTHRRIIALSRLYSSRRVKLVPPTNNNKQIKEAKLSLFCAPTSIYRAALPQSKSADIVAGIGALLLRFLFRRIWDENANRVKAWFGEERLGYCGW
jgi:hypothetical protein